MDNHPDPHRTSSIRQCSVIELERHHHANGNLSVVENGPQLPVEFVRAFYIYDVPAGADRGGHSHFHSMQNFSSGSICLVLASDHYDESDYVRHYSEFKRLTAK